MIIPMLSTRARDMGATPTVTGAIGKTSVYTAYKGLVFISFSINLCCSATSPEAKKKSKSSAISVKPYLFINLCKEAYFKFSTTYLKAYRCTQITTSISY